MSDLGTLGGLVSSARNINNAGKTVGVSATGVGFEHHAFLYDQGKMLDLRSLGGDFSVAKAINSQGQIVGFSSLENGGPGELTHAFLYEKGVMRDIGTLDGTGNSFAFDINDKGQIVGLSNPRAFLFTEQTGMIDLGTLPGGDNSVARAIKNRGDIVRSSGTATSPHAFLYTDGMMIDINTLVDAALGWKFDAAHDINERGQILATGCNPDVCFGVRLGSIASSGEAP